MHELKARHRCLASTSLQHMGLYAARQSYNQQHFFVVFPNLVLILVRYEKKAVIFYCVHSDLLYKEPWQHWQICNQSNGMGFVGFGKICESYGWTCCHFAYDTSSQKNLVVS